MELKNYANECYMQVRKNDLQSDIEKGYITQEQGNQYLAEYAYELKYIQTKNRIKRSSSLSRMRLHLQTEKTAMMCYMTFSTLVIVITLR